MRLYLFFSFLILLFIVRPVNAQNYVGAGLTYVSPMGLSADLNKSATGFNAVYESRKYCKIWYGARIDYFSLDSVDNLKPEDNYYKSAFLFSPEFRYNFIADDCGKYDLIPYVMASLPISIMTDLKEEANSTGLGYGVGAGVAYSFTLFHKCWMLDLNAQYSSANGLLRGEGRSQFNSMNIGLTLSMGL